MDSGLIDPLSNDMLAEFFEVIQPRKPIAGK